MKRKEDSLEKRLRRQAAVPAGLRQQTLQRMGLRPSRPAWVRWARVAAPLAGMAALLITLQRPAVVPTARPAAVKPDAVQAPRPVVAATIKAVPLPSCSSESVSLAGQQSALETGSAPAGSSTAGSLMGVNPAASTAATILSPRPSPAAKDSAAAYSFSVRSNRLRPALGEHLHVALHPSQAGRVTARIFDMQGRVIRELLDTSAATETLSLEWDGSLASGQPAPSGAYVLIVNGPDKTEKVGILILR